MINPQAYHDVISGKRKGFLAALSRACLAGLEVPYSLAVAARNFSYDHGLRSVEKIPVPVISIGNLTLGGTGKTPFTIWLAKWFLEQGKMPGIVSRGYHADESGWNDEAKEIKKMLPDIPQAFSPHRAKAAMSLLNRHSVDLLLFDDCFQYRKLHRNLDIILLDATCEFGYNRLFPRGALREKIASLRRADIVLLSRANLASESKRIETKERVFQIAPHVQWGEVAHVSKSFVNDQGQEFSPNFFSGRNVLPFCGLGNPNAFKSAILSCGCVFKELVVFPDHHTYTEGDVLGLQKKAKRAKVDALICSLKDFVKIDTSVSYDTPIFALTVGIEIISGRKEIESALVALR